MADRREPVRRRIPWDFKQLQTYLTSDYLWLIGGTSFGIFLGGALHQYESSIAPWKYALGVFIAANGFIIITNLLFGYHRKWKPETNYEYKQSQGTQTHKHYDGKFEHRHPFDTPHHDHRSIYERD